MLLVYSDTSCHVICHVTCHVIPHDSHPLVYIIDDQWSNAESIDTSQHVSQFIYPRQQSTASSSNMCKLQIVPRSWVGQNESTSRTLGDRRADAWGTKLSHAQLFWWWVWERGTSSGDGTLTPKVLLSFGHNGSDSFLRSSLKMRDLRWWLLFSRGFFR